MKLKKKLNKKSDEKRKGSLKEKVDAEEKERILKQQQDEELEKANLLEAQETENKAILLKEQQDAEEQEKARLLKETTRCRRKRKS